MAKALQKVMGHYDLGIISEKTQDHLNLAMVAGMIYGSRFGAYRLRKSSERAQRQTEKATLRPGTAQAPNAAPVAEVVNAGGNTVRVSQPGLAPVYVDADALPTNLGHPAGRVQ